MCCSCLINFKVKVSWLIPKVVINLNQFQLSGHLVSTLSTDHTSKLILKWWTGVDDIPRKWCQDHHPSIYKIMTFTSPVVWIHLVMATLGRCQYWSEAQQEQCRFDNFSIPRRRDDEPWKVTWSTGGLLMLSKFIFSGFLFQSLWFKKMSTDSLFLYAFLP